MSDDKTQIEYSSTSVLSDGFGILSRKVMRDKNLTVEAKAIYGYLVSFAGNKNTCYPSRDLMCSELGMSVNRFNKHVNSLKDSGYINVKRSSSGNLKSKNIYEIIMDHRDIEEIRKYRRIQNRDIENEYLENRDIENEYTNSNSINSNSINSKRDNTSEDKSSKNKKEKEVPYKEIIDYLNLKANKKYKYTKTTISKINARCNEGFTLEDFKQVIDIKCNQWINDSKMKVYLRPETLFGTKFESYLNEVSIEENIQIPNTSNTSFEGKSSNDILKELNIEI